MSIGGYLSRQTSGNNSGIIDLYLRGQHFKYPTDEEMAYLLTTQITTA